MLTAGAVYAHPDENPAGSSAAASSRRSGRRCAQAGGDAAVCATSVPWA